MAQFIPHGAISFSEIGFGFFTFVPHVSFCAPFSLFSWVAVLGLDEYFALTLNLDAEFSILDPGYWSSGS